MISYLTPVITAIGIVFSIWRYRNLYNPLFIFNFVWLIIGCVVPQGLWNVWPPTNTAYSIVISGVLGFNFAGLVDWLLQGQFKQKAEFEILKYSKNHSFSLSQYNNNLVYVYIIVTTTLLVLLSLDQINLLVKGYPFYYIRTQYFSFFANETVLDKLRYYVRLLVVSPLLSALYMTAIVDWLFGKRRLVIFISAVILAILDALFSAGRYGLIIFVSTGMIMLIVAISKKRTNWFQSVVFVLTLIIVLSVGIFITTARPVLTKESRETAVLEGQQKANSDTEQAAEKEPESLIIAEKKTESIEYASDKPFAEDSTPNVSTGLAVGLEAPSRVSSILSSIGVYYTGGVTYMGVLLENNPEIIYKTKGVNFLHGLLFPPIAFLTFIGAIDFPPIMNALAEFTAPMINIGDGVSFNSLATMFFPIYEDWGLLGVLLVSFLFAFLCLRAYKKAMSSSSNVYMVILSMLIVQVTHSSTKMFFYGTDYLLQFLYVWPLFIVVHNKKASDKIVGSSERIDNKSKTDADN